MKMQWRLPLQLNCYFREAHSRLSRLSIRMGGKLIRVYPTPNMRRLKSDTVRYPYAVYDT